MTTTWFGSADGRIPGCDFSEVRSVRGRSAPAAGKPRRRREAQKNRNRKHDGDNEDVAPTQVRDRGKANDEAPRADAHRREGLSWKAPELPGDDGSEQHQHGDEQPEANEEIVIGPVEPVGVEVNGLHGLHQRIHTPLRIDLTEAPRMARGEKQQKNRRDPIEQ